MLKKFYVVRHKGPAVYYVESFIQDAFWVTEDVQKAQRAETEEEALDWRARLVFHPILDAMPIFCSEWDALPVVYDTSIEQVTKLEGTK